MTNNKPKLRIYFSAEGNIVTGGYDTQILCRHAVEAALLYEKVPASVEVSLTYTDGNEIKKLNKKYRRRNDETDVLSFPLLERDEVLALTDGDTAPLGDIVLNLERAGVQAAELSHSIEREIAFLVVHSTLHLLGYDHELSPESDEDMCRRQREIVATLLLDEEEEA